MVRYVVVRTYIKERGEPGIVVMTKPFTDIVEAEHWRSEYLDNSPKSNPDNIVVHQYSGATP